MKEQVKKYLVPGIMLLALYLIIRYLSFAEAAVRTFFTAASPLIIGAAAAYLLNILMSRYERWWFPKTKKKSEIIIKKLGWKFLVTSHRLTAILMQQSSVYIVRIAKILR